MKLFFFVVSILGQSLLERLMNRPFYQKDPKTNELNSNVIIKLRNNYRSHPSIISISNELFYENELKACASKGMANFSVKIYFNTFYAIKLFLF